MNRTKQNLKMLFRIDKQGLMIGSIIIPLLFIFCLLLAVKSNAYPLYCVKFLLFAIGSGFIIGLGIANRWQSFLLFINTGNTRLNYFKSVCILNTICIFALSIVFLLFFSIIDLFSGVFDLSYYFPLFFEIIIFYIFLSAVSTFVIEIFFNFGGLNCASSILLISSSMLCASKLFNNTHFLYNGLIINGAKLGITSLITSLLFIITSMILIKKSEVKI